MSPVYLSIDLDYWGAHQARGAPRFLDRVLALGAPTCIVRSHEQILPHTKRFRFDHLINIDFHNDIMSRWGQKMPNDGNWSCFIDKDCREVFEWRYPTRRQCLELGNGRCDVDPCGTGEDVMQSPHLAGWKAVLASQGLRKIPWKDIVGVGIATSTTWWNPTQAEKMSKILGGIVPVRPIPFGCNGDISFIWSAAFRGKVYLIENGEARWEKLTYAKGVPKCIGVSRTRSNISTK